MKMKELITDRLKLRVLTPKVFDYVHQELSVTQQLEFLGLASEEALEIEQKKYEEGLWTHNKKFLYFQLIEKESGKIIGWCGYHTWYTDHDRAEIGYGLFYDEYKRQGLMSEAIFPIIEYGFRDMRLNRIEAFIEPRNKASIRLINKLNFVKEGLLRGHYKKNNHQMEDSAVLRFVKERM